MTDKFDQLIRDGELAKAGRLFAKEGYESGDFGFTRKLLIDALSLKADELEAVLAENESLLKYIKQLENKVKRLDTMYINYR